MGSEGVVCRVKRGALLARVALIVFGMLGIGFFIFDTVAIGTDKFSTYSVLSKSYIVLGFLAVLVLGIIVGAIPWIIQEPARNVKVVLVQTVVLLLSGVLFSTFLLHLDSFHPHSWIGFVAVSLSGFLIGGALSLKAFPLERSKVSIIVQTGLMGIGTFSNEYVLHLNDLLARLPK